MKKLVNAYRMHKASYNSAALSSEYPVVVVGIETTAICNLTCNKCPVGRERQVLPQNAFMEFGLFKKIIDEIKGHSQGVILSYFGEPFLNPRLFEYISYAKGAGLKTQIYSNGIPLSEEIIEKIVISGISEIAFSVDCLPEQYEFYAHMKNIPVEDAKVNLESIIRHIEILMDKLRLAGAKTRVSVIRMDSPQGTELDKYVEFWRSRGVYTSSGLIIDWGGAVERVAANSRIVNSMQCHYPYEIMISSSGEVGMCHIDFNNKFKLGDTNTQAVKEIYNGPVIREIRKKLAQNDYSGLPCENCRLEQFQLKKWNPLLRTVYNAIRSENNFVVEKGIKLAKKLIKRRSSSKKNIHI